MREDKGGTLRRVLEDKARFLIYLSCILNKLKQTLHYLHGYDGPEALWPEQLTASEHGLCLGWSLDAQKRQRKSAHCS